MNAERLLKLYDNISEAPDAIVRLRRFVLDLAVRGKLVEQDAADEPASKLLERIEKSKAGIVKETNMRKPRKFPDMDSTEIWADLPTSWAWTQISNLGFISPRNEAGDSDEASFVPMPMIFAEYGIANEHQPRTWGEIKKGYTHFAEGDVGLAKITPCFENGKSTVFRNLTGGFGSGTTELHILRPVLVDPDYVVLFLKSPQFIRTGIPKMTGTAGQKRVSSEYFTSSPFPLPPLAEQHRIVAKVDELMGLCDRLEEARKEREETRDRLTTASLALLTAPGTTKADFPAHAAFALDALPALTTRSDQIKSLRQTILNLAVRGKLVEQDPADDAVELDASISHGDEPFAIPAGWAWQLLGSLANMINGDRSKNYPNRNEYQPSGIAWINTGHIQPDGRLDLPGMHYISREKFETLRSGKIQSGDLVYCLRGATFGKTGFVEPFTEGAIASSLMIIRLKPDLVDRKFAYNLLMSPYGKEQLLRFDNGTAQPNLSAGNVRKYLIPLPPLAEQRRIVAKVDALMALCDQLETALTKTDATRTRLLEALLHEALEPPSNNKEAAQ
ncbi:restriction endonuclease subunit S [Cohaesibacter haloalkalitolerans]|uniref:restriction endonuclease subunit S n=1 Tax=Cohaesibacter haloalkalitolerans TaxID=1162980 RepID=UPI000E64B273|nr:restriction endonuclease subunit S [Cohaesibacter haloalkalitolerans]